MLKKLHDLGIKSEYAYIAGIVSIGLAAASWLVSNRKERAGVDRADRWGIFVGEWAPTFIALGNGLRSYELQEELQEAGVTKIPQQASEEERRERAGVSSS